jgi:threonine/homoserine/homoserine lactone efflux protein
MWLNLVTIFGTAFVVALTGALMPGPLLAVTIGESVRRGALAGPLLIVGHAILEAVLLGLLALGLAALLKNAAVISAIALAGGAVMCWMGWSVVRSSRHLKLSLDEAGPRKAMHPVVAGVVMSLANPYWLIWWATIGLSYVAMGLRFGLLGVVVFFAGHISADFAWYTLVSVGVAKGRRFMSDRVYRGLLTACGCALIGFGIWFLASGAQSALPCVRQAMLN